MTRGDRDPKRDIAIDIGDGLKLEFVYIKPGKFIMGGKSDKDSKCP